MIRAPRMAGRLLGAQVAHRADDLAGQRVLLARVQFAVEDAGGAEIDQPRAVSALDEDVRRLEVAVDNAMAVGDGQRLGHRHQHVEAALRRHALLAAVLADVLAVDVLHHQVRGTILQRAGSTERDEGRVAQTREQAPLAAESRGGTAAGAGQVHELDGHQLAGLDLAAEVDDAHAAAAQLADRLVPGRQLEGRDGGRNVHAGAIPCGDGFLVGADQRHHQFQERSVAAAGVLDEDGTLFRRHVACAREDGPRTAQAVCPRRVADPDRTNLGINTSLDHRSSLPAVRLALEMNSPTRNTRASALSGQRPRERARTPHHPRFPKARSRASGPGRPVRNANRG